MKKIAQRASACLLLVLFMLGGFSIFLVKYISGADRWVTFQVNRHVYSNAILSVGRVTDRYGHILASMSKERQIFNDSEAIRQATLHTVGDIYGNIGTGVLNFHATDLMGYSIFNGVYSHKGMGNTIKLTIDADLNEVAYRAFAGRKGTAVFYNYITGEILCMVSTPTYDPYYPLSDEQLEWKDYEGVYINRCISSSFTPGSVFKIVTLAAAIENIPNLFEIEFYCEGYTIIENEKITCSSVHGNCDIYDAFAGSCNVAFAQLSQMLSAETIYDYMNKLGLLSSISVSGIPTAKGSYELAEDGSVDLSWSGIGQFQDLVNPMALTRLVAAIANKGRAVNPRLIASVTTEYSIPTRFKYQTIKTKRIMSEVTADKLAEMLRYNVTTAYRGYYSFDRYTLLSAKSGTAETNDGQLPHAWFCGFVGDRNYPIAFTVIVENSGWGLQQAAPIADAVLAMIID